MWMEFSDQTLARREELLLQDGRLGDWILRARAMRGVAIEARYFPVLRVFRDPAVRKPRVAGDARFAHPWLHAQAPARVRVANAALGVRFEKSLLEIHLGGTVRIKSSELSAQSDRMEENNPGHTSSSQEAIHWPTPFRPWQPLQLSRPLVAVSRFAYALIEALMLVRSCRFAETWQP